MTLTSKAITLLLLVFPSLLFADYWQQQVNYDLDVTLIDSVHQISGSETITYINNSPDELNYIWMHLWPNAYKDNETALAKQKFKQFSTKMYFSPDSAFGWIEISDVTVDNEPINWTYRSTDTLDVAKFNLSAPLFPGDTLEIALNFTVQIPNVLSRLGHVGQHYEMTQWYPKPAVYDTKGWHPMSYLDTGEFYSEWGNFDVSITLPANYRVAATGVLQDSSEIAWRDSLAQIGNAFIDTLITDPKAKIVALDTVKSAKPASSDSMKTITFKQNDVHDFAWFADKRFIISSNSVALPSGRSIETWTFSLPQNLKNYRFSNNYIGQSVEYFSDWFIEYPYDHATVVDGDFSAGGGMEYPMITLINNVGFQPLMELVIVHEVGHNWFYGLSGSNERDYPWMDEGLNSYAENRYWLQKYPDNSFFAHHGDAPFWIPAVKHLLNNFSKIDLVDISYQASTIPKTDQAPNLHSEAFSSMNYGAMVYSKAALATEALQAYLGETMMDSVWHAYFSQWAFKHPQPEDLRQVFESVSGEDLSWYFDDMLGSTKQIDYALDDYTSSPRGDSFETTIKVNNQGDYSPPLAIGLTGENDEAKIAWVKPTGDHDVFQINTPFQVQNVVLDPNRNFMDIKRANNDKKLNLDFNLLQFNLNPQSGHGVTILPYLWYDSAEPIVPGLILTHMDLLPSTTMNWYLRTYYGPTTHRAGFSASVGKNYYPEAGKQIKLQSRAKNSWYSELFEVSAQFNKSDLQNSSDTRKLKLALLFQEIEDGEYIMNGDTTRYLDLNVWEPGQYVRGTVKYNSRTRHTLSWKIYELKGTLGAQKGGKPFVKVQSYLNYGKRYSRKGFIRATVFAGYALGDLPTHERFYFSTDMNPEMDDPLFISRSDRWYGAGRLVQYASKYTIPGYAYSDQAGLTPSTKGLVGVNVQADIPKMESIKLIVGAGMGISQDDNDLIAIGSISPALDMGMLQFQYTPVTLQSGTVDTDWKRFQVSLSMNSIRIGI